MLQVHKLPILKKAALFKYGHLQTLSTYDKLCLSLIIPHGSTDMWMYPIQKYALNYGSSFAFFMFQPIRIQFLFLFLYSLYHVKNDIVVKLPLQLLYSLALHTSWICFPSWALTYFAWIHVALHYYRVIPFLSMVQLFSLAMTHVFVYYLLNKFESQDLHFGGTWVPIVIGHIMTNT